MTKGVGKLLSVIALISTSDAVKNAEPEQFEGAVSAAGGRSLSICAGGRHSCVIRDTFLECWGDSEFENNGRREGKFIAVDCGSWHTCALDQDGRALCFGAGYALKSAVPSIPLTKLSAGFADSCGISAGDLSIACWGAKSTEDLKPPEGRFSDVSVGTRSACALSAADGSIRCWGSDEFHQVSSAPTTTGFKALSVGGAHTCALTKGGRINCWGGSDEYRLGRPLPNTKVPHVEIAAGEDHACSLGQDALLRCWGKCKGGACDPPLHPTTHKPHEYVSVAAGGLHTCAARASGEIDCWGDVPTDFPKDNAKIVAAVDGGGGSSSSSIGSDELGMKAAKAMTIDARRSTKQQLGSMLASVKSAVSGLFAAPANATNATEL